MKERRTTERKRFGYYMPLIDDSNQMLVGHLADISPSGFRLDSMNPVSEGKEYKLQMTLTGEVGHKPFMHFGARAIWCKADQIQPNIYYVGFEITKMSKEDADIFQRIVELYGS